MFDFPRKKKRKMLVGNLLRRFNWKLFDFDNFQNFEDFGKFLKFSKKHKIEQFSIEYPK